MQATLYQPVPETLPVIPYIARAKNLAHLRFESSPHGLIELREAFKKAGLRAQEREITYAISRGQRRKDWSGSSPQKSPRISNIIQYFN